MPNEKVSNEFSDLVSRHRDILISLVEADETLSVNGMRSVSTSPEETVIRSKIVAWSPATRDEAYRKLEHLVQALAAGVPIDKPSVDIAVQSVAKFTSKS